MEIAVRYFVSSSQAMKVKSIDREQKKIGVFMQAFLKFIASIALFSPYISVFNQDDLRCHIAFYVLHNFFLPRPKASEY